MDYTIIALDIQGYSNSNSVKSMESKREKLQNLLMEAADRSGFSKFHGHKPITIDTGDGLFLSIDTRDYVTVVRFLDELRVIARDQQSIRFRGVLHTGDCSVTSTLSAAQNEPPSSDRTNLVGHGINEAARYLDSRPLRKLLSTATSEAFVYGITNRVFQTISKKALLRGRRFQEYGVNVKSFQGSLFLEHSYEKLPDEDKIRQKHGMSLTYEFRNFLDSSLTLQYLEPDANQGSKLYVFPDLSTEFETHLGDKTIRGDRYFEEYCNQPRNAIISGGEQSGKTELAKEAFRVLYNQGYLLPIYIRVSERYAGKLVNKISAAIREQYGDSVPNIRDVKKVVIIDDFHLARAKHQQRIVEELSEYENSYFIVFVDSVYNINFVEREFPEDIDFLSIEEFRPSRRNELIQRWLELNGVGNDNYHTIDEYTDFVNCTLMKGLVPATPFNLVVILAEKTAFNPLNSEVTTRGHCYQTLIYLALKKAAIPETQVDIYLNLLEYLAYWVRTLGDRPITSSDFDELLTQYRQEYNLPIPPETVKAKLQTTRIFCRSSIGDYMFTSKYLLYYFVARYLANHRSEKEIHASIQDLYENLQNNRNGYVGVFLVHHLRDESILEEIQLNLMMQYEQYDEATLDDSETDYLLEHVSLLSRLSMSQFNGAEINRQRLLEAQDRSERSKNTISDEDDDFDIIEELAAIRKALKTAEVMGHILKTRTGSFRIENQRQYYAEALKLYLRITKRFIKDFRENKDEFIFQFFDRIRLFDKSKLDREAVYNLATRFFVDVNTLNYLACILRASQVLGSEQILDVIAAVCNEIGTPLANIVRINTEMWHAKQVPLDALKSLYDGSNNFTQNLIRRLLIGYCDMHQVSHADRQRIAVKFEIALERVALPDRTKGKSV